MADLMYLKSGTDIRGSAFSTDGNPADLTAERLQSITWAFANHLERKIGKYEDLKNKPNLQPVATSGKYEDLILKFNKTEDESFSKSLELSLLYERFFNSFNLLSSKFETKL